MDFYSVKIMEAIEWAKDLPVDILAKEVNQTLDDGSTETTAIVIDAATNRLIVGCRRVDEQQAKDAARYRWRRSLAGKSLLELAEIFGLEDGPTTPEEFDAITDAAMQKMGEA